MTILILHTFYRHYGGEDKYVETLAELLRDHGQRVVMHSVMTSDWEKQPRWRKLLLPFQMVYSRAAVRRLERVIAVAKPDIASIHNLRPFLPLTLLRVLRRHHIPMVKKIDNYRYLCLNGLFLRNDLTVCELCKHGNFWHGIVRGCYQYSVLKSLMLAVPIWLHRRRRTLQTCIDRFYCPSYFTRDLYISAGFAASQFAVLPNMISLEAIKTFQEPEDYAIYIGRLSPEKGLGTLLEAAARLPQMRFKIIGKGPLLEPLRARAQAMGLERVEFLGYVEIATARDLLARAMFMVFPTECYESYPTVILESYASGVPVIASRLGGVCEMVEEGVSGLLFEPRDVAGLCAAITRLAGDPNLLDRMRIKALAAFSQVVEMDQAFLQRLALYQDVIARHDRHPA
jgi:glycosyltransferase involved in cell wall biosynthesis